MIELWHSPLSPCAQKVRIVLAEKGLDWTDHILNLADKENLRPEYLALNPKGVVPTLRDDGVVITESSIIIEYLDDRYPEPALKPREANLRAEMRHWIKLVDERIHPAFGELGWPIMVRPAWLVKSEEQQQALLMRLKDPKRRDRQARLLKAGVTSPETQETLRILDSAMASMGRALEAAPWLCGNNFSLADAALLPYIVALDHFGMVELIDEKHPRVSEWLMHCKERASFERAIRAPVTNERWEELLTLGGEALQTLKHASLA